MKSKIKTLSVILFVVILSFILISCKGKKKNETELLRISQDSLRKASNEFILETGKKFYNNWVEGEELKVSSTYKKYSELFSMESIELINKLLKIEQRKERIEKLNRIKVFIYNELVNSEVIELTEKVENIKNKNRIFVQGEYLEYYSLRGRLANEKNPQVRQKYFNEWTNFLSKTNPISLKKLEKSKKLIDSLGFKGGYVQFSEMIRDLNFKTFTKTVEGFLVSTNEMYNTLLTDILKANKMNQDNFFRQDLYRLLRNEKYDKYFKADSLLITWKNTFTKMGFNPDSINNLKLDSEDKQNKNSRPVCFPIEIPNDIRMSIKPTGGYSDYSSLFHETGHGLHFAFTQENDFEMKYLGNYTLTETYAFLFEHLLDETGWLATAVNIPSPEIKGFIKFRAFQRLYMVRRYCAKFLYEMKLYDSTENAQKTYSEILSSVLGYKASIAEEKLYLEDVDDFFYVVDYLRAWYIEAMLKTVIKEKFGDDWYQNPSIAEYLKEYFKTGQRMTVEEFLKSINYFDIDAKFLYNDINSMIEYSKQK